STESLASLGKSLYASRAVVFVVDKSMRVILWNDCAIELTGLTRDEVAGRSFIDLPGLVPLGATAVLERALQSCIDPSKGKSVANLAGWDEVKPSYHLEAVLGQGSYGQVVRCKHLIREIVCPQDILRFQNIFVVFEYLPSDLEKLLHSPQFLTAEHIRWLLLDLLKALKYMHSAAIVHRDLKPANVLLNLSPVAIKICDYGLARTLTNSQLSHPSTKRKRGSSSPTMPPAAASTSKGKKIQRQLTEHVVTRWYRAPEIIFRDHDYSTGIDVWSVGCIFAELLSMQKSSVPSHYAREPLFPGVSCFPLSPGAGQRALPQDSQDQLNTILRVLGSMADEDIAEIADPDVRFYLRNLPPQPRKSFAEMYPGAEKEAIDLLDRMLQMNPRKRMTVDDALSHPYLASIRSIEDVDDDIVAPHPIQLDFDDSRGPLPIPEIRRLMTNEIAYYHPHVAQHVQAAIPPRPPQHRKLNHS
ncbi:hypothetical protein DYB32_000734, partial [Aphanomyces invadans]